MALAFQRNEVSVECTGTVTTVPDNDVARLMYYLNCVCTVIDCNHDPEIRRFTNYKNYHSLSVREQAELVVVCYTFSPDVFDDKVFFHSDALCGSSSNEFYRINQVRHQLLAAESIIIAGQTRQVNQIMTYKLQWMRSNYIEPMERLARRLNNASRAITYRSASSSDIERQPLTHTSSSTCTTTRLCLVLGCVLVGLVVVVVAVVYILKATKS